MKENNIHICVWVFYFLIAYFSDLILDPSTKLVTEIIIFITHNVFLFYSILYTIKFFSINSKINILLSIFRCILLIVIFFTVKYILIYLVYPIIYGQFTPPSKLQWITVGILWIINYSLFASAYFYFKKSIWKQKDLNKIMELQLIQEKEKLELENTLLKAQINPHFLYNALNFLYAKSLSFSQELSDGIMRLSDIMRYSLKPHDKDGLVSLSEEIAHIQNVIGMAQLRFNNKVYIDFAIKGTVTDEAIIPFVLITLVENVLKHGAINREQHPAKITLEVVTGKELKFCTWNIKRRGPKEQSTSIGLSNTTKRLEYAYGKGCTFEITDNADDFSVKLNIPLATQTLVA